MTGNKYHARRAPCGDHVHDSQAERARCWVLQQRERLGEIQQLRRQTRWPLEVNGVPICVYVCDFDYFDTEWRRVLEDTKGVRTRDYRIKAKLMQAVYGITIR